MDAIRPSTQDEQLLKRLGMYTPEMLASLSDARERDRYTYLMVNLIDKKPYLAQFLMSFVVHTGRDAIRYGPTACVWIGLDMSVHLAMNPFFMQSLEHLDVQRGALPLDPNKAQELMQQNWAVAAYEPLPRFASRFMEEHNIAPKGPNEWVAVRANYDQQISILEHEVLHVLHQHLENYGDRGLYPDAQVLNLAMDVAINQFIENLPAMAVTIESYANDEQYPLELPKNEGFAAYYRMLVEYYKDAERGSVPDPKKPQKSGTQGFPEGTLVATPRGDIPIEHIRVNDTVWTLDDRGQLVERYVLAARAKFAHDVNTSEQLKTEFCSLSTTSHSLQQVSTRAKVWVDGKGWQGVGAQINHIDVRHGYPPQPRPPVQIGESIRTITGSYPAVEPVTALSTEPDVRTVLYSLCVQPVDCESSFFANGIWVKGYDRVRAPKQEGDEPPPQDGPKPPPDDDDDVEVQPPPSGGGGPPPPPGQGPPPPPGGGEGESSDGEGQPGEGESQGTKGEEEEEGELITSPSNAPEPRRGEARKPAVPKKPKSVPAPVDDHSHMDKPALPGRLQREVIGRIVKEAEGRMKQKNMWGTAPGHIRRLIEELLKDPTVDWKRLMRKWTGTTIRISKRSTRKKPSRRWGFDYPGTKVVRGARIWLAVDNSGSITTEELRQFGAEASRLLEFSEVILIVWDTEIVQVKKIRNQRELVEAFKDLGGGGGSTAVPKIFQALHNPALLTGEAKQLLTTKPTGIIILTDGDILWPNEGDNRGIPVLWGITREPNVGKQPFGLGMFVDVGNQ
jgi:predicted metal-dependent peptidase